MLGVRESFYVHYTVDTTRYLLGLGEPRSRLVILGSQCSPCGEDLAMDHRTHRRRVAEGYTVAGRARRALHQRHKVPSCKAFGMRSGPGSRGIGVRESV